MSQERITPGTVEWALYSVEHKQRYEFFASRLKDRRVIDAACGVGYGTCMLADAGAKSVVGLDISENAIDYANQHFIHPGVEFQRLDVEELSSLNIEADAVVSFETIEHLHDPSRFVEGVKKSLVSDGIFICSTPNRNYRYRGEKSNPYHLNEMTYGEFIDLFSRCFDVVEEYHQSPTPAYLRHLDLINRLNQFEKSMRFSKVLRLENWVRKRLGRASLNQDIMSDYVPSAIPGDYIIEEFDHPDNSLLTFILVGTKKQN